MYLNLIQIAESFGVSESVVEDWIRNEGLPHTPDRGRLLFDRVQVANWAAARGLAAKAGFLAPETPALAVAWRLETAAARGLAAKAGFLAPETPALAVAWRLETLMRAGGIWRDVAAEEVPGVLERIIGALPGATPPIRQILVQRLRSKDGV